MHDKPRRRTRPRALDVDESNATAYADDGDRLTLIAAID